MLMQLTIPGLEALHVMKDKADEPVPTQSAIVAMQKMPTQMDASKRIDMPAGKREEDHGGPFPRLVI